MLQLAGYNLIGDNEDREVEQLIKKFIPMESYMPWLRQSWPGFGLQHITSSYRIFDDVLAFKIGRYRHPTGATRFGYGHFLINSDSLAMVATAAYDGNGGYNTITLSMGNPESNQQGTLNALEQINVTVYMLPPTPLSGIRGLTGMVQSLYLVTVVDTRYFWWWQNFGNIMITSSTTWQSLIDGIGTTLGLEMPITVDIIDPAYLNPSIEMFQLPYEPIPVILDAIATNIGMRVVVDYGGNVFMMLYGTALGLLNSDMQSNIFGTTRQIMAGGQAFSSIL